MKKALLAAVGLGGLLASCGGGVQVVVTDPVRNLKLLSYQSQYTLPTAYTDTKTGTQYAAGTSIICDNLSTRLSVTTDWDGTINLFGARLEGRDSTQTRTVFSNPLGNVYSQKPSVFEFVVGPRTAPLSVKPQGVTAQAIVVTPVNTFTVKGASFVTIQAQSSDGTVSNAVPSVQALPVADCSV